MIRGNVRDTHGAPIAGAAIMMKGSGRGTTTDHNGDFSIAITRAPGAAVELTVSFLGRVSKNITVTTVQPLNVVLEEDAVSMQQVVVRTGLIDKARESFVGSARIINKTELKAGHSRNLLQTVAMMEPSLQIIENNLLGSNPNALPELQLRGASSFRDITDLQNNTGTQVNTPLFIYDGFEISLERFMDLNEDDIESITILKDASATAMYGSRGANGVIVVTPTVPVPGEIRISYKGEVKFEIPDLSSYNLLNAKQKLEVESAAGIWDDHLDEFQSLIDNVYEKNINTDWLGMATRTGVGHVHRVSIMGGDETLRFLANLSYADTQGAMKDSYRKNFNGTFTLRYSKKKFTANNSLNINLVNTKESPYGSFSYIAQLNPYWTTHDDEGNWNKVFNHVVTGLDSHGESYANPAYNATLGSVDKSRRRVISNNLQLRYDFTPDLRAEGRFSIGHEFSGSDKYVSAEHTMFLPRWEWDSSSNKMALRELDPKEKGLYTKGGAEGTDIEGALTVVYGKTIGKHIINAGVNMRIASTKSENYSATAMGYLSDKSYQYGNGLGYPGDTDYNPTGLESVRRSLEFIATVNYNYDMRYFIDLMVRADGGSSFGKHSRWKEFYSGGAGWNLHREHFLENATWLDLFRLKYSFGVSGGIAFKPGQGNYLYGYNFDDYYADWVGATMIQYGNENLTWKQSYTHNMGLDLEMFNGRLEAEVAYYNQLTENDIMVMAFSPSHGYRSFQGNVGKVRNRGLELQLSGTLVRNDSWLIKLNTYMARNKNIVINLSQEMKEMIRIEERNNQITDTNRYTYRVGRSMDAIYVLRSLGIDPATGNRIYVNKNGQSQFHNTGLGDAMVYAGDAQPKVNGLATALVSFRGLTLTFGFQFRWGAKALNQTLLDKVENVDWAMNVDRRVYSDRWRQMGDRSTYKNIGAGVGMSAAEAAKYVSYANTEFVQKNDNFAWTYCNISYNVPTAWLDKHLGRIKRLNLTANLSDLFYSGTMRRERGLEYPYSVNPNFSVSVTF